MKISQQPSVVAHMRLRRSESYLSCSELAVVHKASDVDELICTLHRLVLPACLPPDPDACAGRSNTR